MLARKGNNRFLGILWRTTFWKYPELPKGGLPITGKITQ